MLDLAWRQEEPEDTDGVPRYRWTITGASGYTWTITNAQSKVLIWMMRLFIPWQFFPAQAQIMAWLANMWNANLTLSREVF